MFLCRSLMRFAHVEVRRDLQKPSANAWQACKGALVYFFVWKWSTVKDPFVYSIDGKRWRGEHMKFICLLFFNEILVVLLKLSEL